MSYLSSAETRARIREANAEDQKVYDFVATSDLPKASQCLSAAISQADLRKLQEQESRCLRVCRNHSSAVSCAISFTSRCCTVT